MLKKSKFLTIITLLIVSSAHLVATDFTWTGGDTGDWEIPSNWNVGSSYPGGSATNPDTAIFNVDSGSPTVTLTDSSINITGITGNSLVDQSVVISPSDEYIQVSGSISLSSCSGTSSIQLVSDLRASGSNNDNTININFISCQNASTIRFGEINNFTDPITLNVVNTDSVWGSTQTLQLDTVALAQTTTNPIQFSTVGSDNNTALVLNTSLDNSVHTLSGAITGDASLSFTPQVANATWHFTAPLEYTGLTAVEGTVTMVYTPVQSSGITIVSDPNASLEFRPPASPSQIYANMIDGTTGGGSLKINGEGKVYFGFESLSTLEAPFTINQGSVYFPSNTSITSDLVTLDAGAAAATAANLIFSGAATVTGDLTNTKGTLVLEGGYANNTVQDVSITGDYVQGSDGVLKVNVYPNTSDASLPLIPKLAVTGTADLGNGVVELNLANGVYKNSAAQAVVSAAGGLGGTTFSSDVTANFGNWVLSYDTNEAKLALPSDVTVRSIPAGFTDSRIAINNFLKENSEALNLNGDWYDSSMALSEDDYTLFIEGVQVIQNLVNAASETSVSSFIINHNLHAALLLDRQYQNNVRNARLDCNSEMPCFAQENTGFFVTPFGNIWHQNNTSKRAGFKAGTYGLVAGWEQVFADNFVYEGGLGYSHANLSLTAGSTNIRWSSLYVSPCFFGWFNARAFANAMVMGTFNFYKSTRVIKYAGARRVADGKYNTYDVLVRFNGGYRIPLFASTWFQPEGTLNYDTMFSEGYTETGAGTLGAQVKSNTGYLLQPSFRARMIWETVTDRFCFAPSLYVGWLSYIPLGNVQGEWRFANVPGLPYLTFQGYNEMINQLILGGEFYMKRLEKFELKGEFEVNLLNQIQSYNFDVKFQWFF